VGYFVSFTSCTVKYKKKEGECTGPQFYGRGRRPTVGTRSKKYKEINGQEEAYNGASFPSSYIICTLFLLVEGEKGEKERKRALRDEKRMGIV
jgi:hypothetical protein